MENGYSMDKIKKSFLGMWKFYGGITMDRMKQYNKYKNPNVLVVATTTYRIYTYFLDIIGRSRLEYRNMVNNKGEWEDNGNIK